MPLHGTVGQLLNRLIAAGVGQRPVIFVTHRYLAAVAAYCHCWDQHLYNTHSHNMHPILVIKRMSAAIQCDPAGACDAFGVAWPLPGACLMPVHGCVAWGAYW